MGETSLYRIFQAPNSQKYYKPTHQCRENRHPLSATVFRDVPFIVPFQGFRERLRTNSRAREGIKALFWPTSFPGFSPTRPCGARETGRKENLETRLYFDPLPVLLDTSGLDVTLSNADILICNLQPATHNLTCDQAFFLLRFTRKRV